MAYFVFKSATSYFRPYIYATHTHSGMKAFIDMLDTVTVFSTPDDSSENWKVKIHENNGDGRTLSFIISSIGLDICFWIQKQAVDLSEKNMRLSFLLALQSCNNSYSQYRRFWDLDWTISNTCSTSSDYGTRPLSRSLQKMSVAC